VRVSRLELRDFRNYAQAEVGLGEAITVVVGPNGAGKTNLLEALYFGCTARSPRTSDERELVRDGHGVTRVALRTAGEDVAHAIEVGFAPGEPKRLRVDGADVDSLSAVEVRPLVSVFMPERLGLVKGAPSGRRAHVDRVAAALRPARAETRPAYSRALAQRNALLGRARAGATARASLDAWDAELARHGARLMAERREALEELSPLFVARGRDLGLPAAAEVRYRPRSPASSAGELQAELAERREADLERGFTAHGPHRDEVELLLRGRSLRAYGSQGEQRAALLALLLAERDLLAARRSCPPLMLLDDVMSELDSTRRKLLAAALREGGQAVVTATDVDQVPGARDAGVVLLEIENGSPRQLGAVAPELAVADA
jgi:DNA replication and repair protein RecF